MLWPSTLLMMWQVRAEHLVQLSKGSLGGDGDSWFCHRHRLGRVTRLVAERAAEHGVDTCKGILGCHGDIGRHVWQPERVQSW